MLHIGMLKTLVAGIPTLSSQRYLLSVYPVVYNHWTGMERCIGMVEWGQRSMYCVFVYNSDNPRPKGSRSHDTRQSGKFSLLRLA